MGHHDDGKIFRKHYFSQNILFDVLGAVEGEGSSFQDLTTLMGRNSLYVAVAGTGTMEPDVPSSITEDSLEVTKTLIEEISRQGVYEVLHDRDKKGMTPLQYSAKYGLEDHVLFLCEAAAQSLQDPQMRDMAMKDIKSAYNIAIEQTRKMAKAGKRNVAIAETAIAVVGLLESYFPTEERVKVGSTDHRVKDKLRAWWKKRRK